MPLRKENLLKELKIQGLRVFSLDMDKKQQCLGIAVFLFSLIL